MKIQTKYNGSIDFEIYRKYTIKSIFKILPLREENKKWRRYLEGLLYELNGFNSLTETTYFIALLCKLESLFNIDDMKDFRKIVFDSIDLLKKIEVS